MIIGIREDIIPHNNRNLSHPPIHLLGHHLRIMAGILQAAVMIDEQVIVKIKIGDSNL